MGKITNRKEALNLKDNLEELNNQYFNSNNENIDWFGKIEEIVLEDDYCMYLIEKYSKLSQYWSDDFEEYSKEHGKENPLEICFEEIISYLSKIILGNFEDNIKEEIIPKGSSVEVNGLNFAPVSRINLADVNGESFVYLYDGNDLIARIPFFDIISYKISLNEEEIY